MVLQARGLEFVDEHLVFADPSLHDRMWKVSERCGMQFCPLFGEKTARVVARCPDRFETLASASCEDAASAVDVLGSGPAGVSNSTPTDLEA